MLIGKKIKHFAIINFKTLKNFANILDIHYVSLIRYGKDIHHFSFEMLRKLIAVGCELNWLLDDNISLDAVPKVTPCIKLPAYKYSEYIHVYIGQRLRNFGYKKYTNMHEFARALEIHHSTLYSYINGRILPGSKFLIKLLKLGCDIDWLLQDSNSTDSIPFEFELQNKVVESTIKNIDSKEEKFLYSIAKTKFNSVENMAKALKMSRQALYPYLKGKPLTTKLFLKLESLGVNMRGAIEMQDIKNNRYSNKELKGIIEEKNKIISTLNNIIARQNKENKKLNNNIRKLEEKINSLNDIIVQREFTVKEEEEKRKKIEEKLFRFELGNHNN